MAKRTKSALKANRQNIKRNEANRALRSRLRTGLKAIRKAIVLYRHPELFRATQIRGMETDFSWERTAEDYLRFYDDLLAARL